MRCCYCGTDIQKQLPFCTHCYEPLIACPKCDRYFSPLANFCNQCETFLGALSISEHGTSNSIRLSDLLEVNAADTSPSVNAHPMYLEGSYTDRFNLDPLLSLGYMFVVSNSGHIWVLNPITLKKYNVELTQAPLTQVKSNPKIFRQIVQRGDGVKQHKNFLCVVSNNEISLLSVEYRSKSSPLVIRSAHKWDLHGQCLTDPLCLKDKIIIGTDKGLVAYNIDKEKCWEYNNDGALLRENIVTLLSAIGDKIFFGSHTGNTGHIHCVQAYNGSPVWDEPYTIFASGLGNIYAVPESERLILFDHDGNFYNLDVDGRNHYPPVTGTISKSEQPASIGRIGNRLYIVTSLARIHCLDSLGSMVKPHFDTGGQFFFYSQPAIGADFIVFAAHNGSLLFVETAYDSYNILKVREVKVNLPVKGEVMTNPIISGKYLYVLSNNGHIVKVGVNQGNS